MKKVIVLLLIVLSMSVVFSTEFKINSVISSDSLYKENPFDPYGFNTEIGVVYLPVKEERELEFLTYYSDTTGKKPEASTTVISENLPLYLKENDNSSFFIKGKLSVNKSVLVSTVDFGENFPKITIDLNVKGYFATVFEPQKGLDLLSFDGSFFVGPEIKLGDSFVLRTGVHHLSGHYGDETLDTFDNTHLVKHNSQTGDNTITINGEEHVFYGLAQYVRDNEFLFGLQKSFDSGFTLYCEYCQPLYTSFVRPFFECPASHNNSINNKAGLETWIKLAFGDGIWNIGYPGYVGTNEQIKTEWEKLSKFYKAVRISTGFTWEKTFHGKYQLIFGLDIKAHQDGQTKHKLGSYDSSNPWEFEFTVGTEFDFCDAKTNRLGFQLIYHCGRFQALNLFTNRVNSLYFGMTLGSIQL